MQLIERYLQATGFWLPKTGKHDILAELAEDLHAQVEEREAALGRGLTEAEIAALLKQKGRPMLVANAYLPQRYVIGPLLFPLYSFVLKIVAACYVVPWFLVWLGIISSPAWRATHGGAAWFSALVSAWGSLWTAALVAMGIVTLVFAVLERVSAKTDLFGGWKPEQLPRLRKPGEIPRSGSMIEVAVNVVALAWWADRMAPLLVINQPTVQVLLTPLWHTFFWAFWLVWLGSTVLAAVNVARPYWTVPRAAAKLGLDMALSALFYWLAQAHIVSGMVIANVSAERAVGLTQSFNLWAERCLPVVVIVGVVIATCNGFRLVRVMRGLHGSKAQYVRG